MRKEAERLVRQARRDIENARKIIATGAFEVVAFLSQQAVEKYLKAAWVETRRKRPPATHSLRELAEGLDLRPELLPRLSYLNPDYTVSRDPDAANSVPYELYDEHTARAKVQAAEEIAACIETLARLKADRVRQDPRVNRFVEQHLPRLRKLYEPELVLVFGSRARGDALEESDLDLIIVSGRFAASPSWSASPGSWRTSISPSP